ncbi:hypothetical protein AOXY_G17102 [Acipenser oxyrinchus oxyrinchus]|uniref:Uncharacterized protein n=1 Tax=Acipenser oxyrinchus oxyrinchus TaxID=40147 RepID=A0AAD8G0W5_ACIOX|nr:hypothetical protein AOXY_G17102 [Acipenser oxyrinchus oxyrinchus]
MATSTELVQKKGDAAMVILEKLEEAIPLQELWQGQEETARWLEVSYLSLHEFPDVEAELRQNAVSCRQQQSLATNLVQKFNGTSRQIVEDLIPQVRDAVELLDAELAKDTIEMAVKWTSDMKKDAKDTQYRYQEIIINVNKNISSAKKKKEEVIHDKARLAEDEKKAEEMRKAIEEKKQKYKKEKEDAEKELDDEKKKAKALNDKYAQDNDLLDCFTPEMRRRPEKKEKSKGFFGLLGISQIVETIFDTEGKKREQDRKDRREVNEQLTKKREEVLKMANQDTEAEQELIEKRALLERLKNTKEMMGDESTLLTVVKYLAHVDEQLQRCIDFWDKMEGALGQLAKKTELGTPFLKKLENEKYQERYLAKLGEAESYWKMFSVICTKYVEISKGVEGKNLYAFLDGRVDSMSDAERKTAIEKLAIELGKQNLPAIMN